MGIKINFLIFSIFSFLGIRSGAVCSWVLCHGNKVNVGGDQCSGGSAVVHDIVSADLKLKQRYSMYTDS